MVPMILSGLAAAVLIAAVARSAGAQPQPPQIIYVQAVPAEPEPGASGCLPLLILVAVVVLAVVLV